MHINTKIAVFACITLIILISTAQVAAIRCHQCNSRLDAGCDDLLLNTPRLKRDNQFLKECQGVHSINAFCRKTVIEFGANDEVRIERGCGWIPESHQNTCFTADNEGYKQVVCSCTGDGCNGARAITNTALLTLASAMLLIFYNKVLLQR